MRVLLPLLLLSVSAGNRPPKKPAPAPPPEFKLAVTGNTSFAVELHRELRDPGANLVFSPFSVSSLLAMAHGGARANTARQIADVLHLADSSTGVSAFMSRVHSELDRSVERGKIVLTVGNSVWMQQGYGFKHAFLNLLESDCRAEINLVDFTANHRNILKEMNGWVSLKTKGKIGSLLAGNTITPDTRLVLLNTIYFKGKWASRFKTQATRRQKFRLADRSAVPVPIMKQENVFDYREDPNTQLLELPYIGGDLSMLILLPRTSNGLSATEDSLQPGQLNAWIDQLRPRTVDVSLPKFQVASRYSLNRPLAALGAPDAFDPARADFTGVTDRRPLCLTHVAHAAMIEVDEEGTVAAAASGAAMGCSAKPPPAAFHADHPFLFFIRDNHSGALLFAGRIVDPR